MHSHYANTTKEILDLICHLARKKDQKILADLVKSGVCIGLYYGEYNPVMLLAEEKNKESVDFLINEFKASRNHAAEGYARGGHVNEVNQQIAQGASCDYAVC